jgi:acetoin:2,6-dichlorophenolindophenol oxidoreductase subunit alpha
LREQRARRRGVGLSEVEAQPVNSVMPDPLLSAVSTRTSLSQGELLRMLQQMLEIRYFEEEVQLLFAKGLVRGSTHLCQGQEAVCVGACTALNPGDSMLCTYRGHGAVLAMGAPLDRCFAEILGRAGGLCGGKGGSMHLTDVNVGAYGSFAVVGAHLPIALGIGLAARYRSNGAVSVCFFGDGAVNIGAFHESMNLASVWKLPVIFVCENNLYGEYSPIATTTAIDRLADRADAYRIANTRLDGNDVVAVHAGVSEGVERARAGDGPTFIEALTYRHKGHSRSDPATYRPKGELEGWLERDPILILRTRLIESGLGVDAIDAADQVSRALVAEAVARALKSPEPDLESRLDHVFA